MFLLTPSHPESISQSTQVPEPRGGAGGRVSWVEPCHRVCRIQVQNVKHTPIHNSPAAFSWGQSEMGGCEVEVSRQETGMLLTIYELVNAG